MNWNVVIGKVGVSTVVNLVSKDLSLRSFYETCIEANIGPEARKLYLMGAARARKAAREALRRRNTTVS